MRNLRKKLVPNSVVHHSASFAEWPCLIYEEIYPETFMMEFPGSCTQILEYYLQGVCEHYIIKTLPIHNTERCIPLEYVYSAYAIVTILHASLCCR